MKTYTNPILPGFHPDPSIVRVGEDYYLVTSTFQYFPAITIQHSRDLIHWKIIGHGITESSFLDLTHTLDGCGIWAADITWHQGVFYLSLCLVQLTKDRSINLRGNYLVRSTKPEGPYDRPMRITSEGNDPSLFFDDDGTPYLLYAAGIPQALGTKIVQLDAACTRVVDGPYWMNWGQFKRAPEGPHLLKKDGWYYHLMACGGIGPQHQERIARSRSITGPYEPNPADPFLFQTKSDARIQLSGHTKLFQTQAGDWWMVSLCQRQVNGVSPLGRETALDRIDWTDGWPVVNQGKGPCDEGQVPELPASPVNRPDRDDFSSPQLAFEWLTVRNPREADRSLQERPGFLRIYTGPGELAELHTRNTTVRREQAWAYCATLSVQFQPQQPGPQAGLVCYYDTSAFLQFGITWNQGLQAVVQMQGAGQRTVLEFMSLQPALYHYLRVEVEGLKRQFFYSRDQIVWTLVAAVEECRFLSDQGTLHWPFTGTMVGMFAVDGGTGLRIPADFDWFEMVNPLP